LRARLGHAELGEIGAGPELILQVKVVPPGFDGIDARKRRAHRHQPADESGSRASGPLQ